ncbi:YfiR family protein [Pseudoduganella sp. LjRoot289]|uniref:YfiR family protein n=1 Tax=Pseudoduganella sp. LjRoot289 TaxID=3342314 RepID=UPI003ECC1EE6
MLPVRLPCFLLALLLAPLCHAQVQVNALKAAYIYNIAMFTTWPAVPAGVAAERSLTVCARPTLPFWESLRQLEGKAVNGRTWTLFEPGAAPRACDIVIFAGELPLPRPMDGAGVLYVADGGKAGKSAAAVTLVDEDQHVRFDIDTREAARLGLKFSSRLLRLARNVW